jgi:HEAT repeat protein
MKAKLASMRHLAAGITAMALSVAAAAGELDRPVSLETRWWGEHDFAYRLAEGAGLRWAITDGISSRGRTGGENVAAAKLAEEYEKATGIKLEVIGGVLVAHRPSEAKRKELEAKLSAGGEPFDRLKALSTVEGEAIRAAWLLGFLKDANAWPALAKASAGKDLAVALSAAHALRRLDGEEDFRINRWQPGAGDAGLSQLPLGAVFKEPVAAADLEALSKSPFVTLREAAARLAAGSGSGKTLAESLTKDPSLYVRQAATRTLRAWETPPAAKPRQIQKPDLAKVWADFTAKGEDGPRLVGGTLALYGSEEDLKKLVEIYNTTQNVHIRFGTLAALTYNAGGPAVTEMFRKLAPSGAPWPAENHEWGSGRPLSMGKYGLAMLFDGEALVKELGPRLGTEHWAFSSEFVLARFGGPPAIPELQKVLTKRGHVAPLAVGYIGGPDAVKMLEPLLASEDLSAATAAARGLGESGQLSAVAPLVKALSSPNRVVRSRAALALGRIGGPEAAAALAALLKSEKEHLPKRSACAMLKEIMGSDPLTAKGSDPIISAAEKELAEFVPAFNPVNPKLGADFAAGKLVGVSGVLTVASVGETRCAVDQYSGLWMRYGGCSGCYSNECTAFDVASGKWFVVRPPENLGLFFNETRAAQGCSRGMAYDAKSRCFFINHAVGGNGNPSNWAMYPGRSICRYDAALDRFEGNFPGYRQDLGGGEGPTWFIADSTRGLIVSEWMGPVTWALDTATNKLVDLKFDGAPPLPEKYLHEPAGYDPVSGLIVRWAGGGGRRKPENQGLWLFDVAGGKAAKSKGPLPAGEYGGGNAMAWDACNRELVLFLSTGVWRYDRAKDEWEKAADGDGKIYVVDYDPQHNVFLALRPPGSLVAFRLKGVAPGTKAFYGEKK